MGEDYDRNFRFDRYLAHDTLLLLSSTTNFVARVARAEGEALPGPHNCYTWRWGSVRLDRASVVRYELYPQRLPDGSEAAPSALC